MKNHHKQQTPNQTYQLNQLEQQTDTLIPRIAFPHPQQTQTMTKFTTGGTGMMEQTADG